MTFPDPEQALLSRRAMLGAAVAAPVGALHAGASASLPQTGAPEGGGLLLQLAEARRAAIPPGVTWVMVADRANAIFVADPEVTAEETRNFPLSTFRDRGGRGFRLDVPDGIILIDWLGARADDPASDLAPAFAEAMRLQTGPGSHDAASAGTILFGLGRYRSSAPLSCRKAVRLVGHAGGMAGNSGTELYFPNGTHGIVLNSDRVDPDMAAGAGGSSAETGAATGSIIENLTLIGSGSGAADGLLARTRFTARSLSAFRFGRDGIHVLAGATEGGGNASSFLIEGGRVYGNRRDGFRAHGGDASAGTVVMLDATGNGGYGLNDISFLGNTFVGCHTESNGLYTDRGTTGRTGYAMVRHQGRLYTAVFDNQRYASTTEPGTNPAIWCEFLTPPDGPPAIENCPQWHAGIAVEAGGCFASHSPAATGGAFINCYAEGAQPPAFISNRGLLIQGVQGAGVAENGARLHAGADGRIESRTGFVAPTDRTGRNVAALGGDRNAGDLLRFSHGDHAPRGYRLLWTGEGALSGNLSFNYGLDLAQEPFFATGPNTTTRFGRAVPQPYVLAVRALALGAGIGSPSGGRQVTALPAAPTQGVWAKGDIVFNTGPEPGGWVGWVCVRGTDADGIGALFKGFGRIED